MKLTNEASSGRLIGRERELRELRDRIDGTRGLVSLVGVAGIGKSALARTLLSAELRTGKAIVMGAADVLSVPAQSAFVIVDDVEKATPAFAKWIGSSSRSLIVTSRHPLGVEGENVFRVRGLTRSYGSELVRTIVGVRVVSSEVDALVGLLEGHPGALEVAARTWRRRVRRGSFVAAMQDDPFETLGDTERAWRFASLRAAMKSSLDSLSLVQLAALERVAVFERGVPLSLAEMVGGKSAREREALQSLIDSGVLDVEVSRATLCVAFLFRALLRETMTKKALNGLGTLHARICLDETARRSFDVAHLRAECEAIVARGLLGKPSTPNVRAASQAALIGGASMATLTQLIAREKQSVVRVRLMALRSRKQLDAGKRPAALRGLSDAMKCARRVADANVRAELLIDIGLAHQHARNRERAEAHYRSVVAMKATAPKTRGRALCNLATVLHDLVRFEEARTAYERAIPFVTGDLRLEGAVVLNLGVLLQEEGDLTVAATTLERAVELLERSGDARLAALARTNLGAVRHELGQARIASELHSRSIETLVRSEDVRSLGLCRVRWAMAMSASHRADDARAELDAGEQLLSAVADDVTRAFVTLGRAYVRTQCDLAAEGANAALAAARNAMSEARSSAFGKPSAASLSDDVRFALRMVEQAAADSLRYVPTLTLKAGAIGFRPPEASWESLEQRPACRRILLHLIESARGGRTAALTHLWQAGWPNDSALEGAWQNRVHVALSYLRSHGLRDWIIRSEDGYFLHPRLGVAIE